MSQNDRNKRGPQKYADKFMELLKQSKIQVSQIQNSIENQLFKHSPRKKQTMNDSFEQSSKTQFKLLIIQKDISTNAESNYLHYNSQENTEPSYYLNQQKNIQKKQEFNKAHNPCQTELDLLQKRFQQNKYQNLQTSSNILQPNTYFCSEDNSLNNLKEDELYRSEKQKSQYNLATDLYEYKSFQKKQSNYSTYNNDLQPSYELTRIRSIGVGAHSFVYLTQQTKSNTLYAQKSISRTHANFQQLLNEVKILCFMNHPNLIQLYHVYSDSNYIHLILEYAQDSLFQLKKRFKVFKEKEIIEVLKQLLRAVVHLHSHGVVHADIKVQNIMIGNGTIKLCDLGYAHIEHTAQKEMVGTLDYLAPQYVLGVDSGCKRDIWAVGILAFELLVGQGPLQGLSEGEKWSKLIRKDKMPYLDDLAAKKEELAINHHKIDQIIEHTLCPYQDRWSAKQLLDLPIFK